jgi:HlyD family secretion protein
MKHLKHLAIAALLVAVLGAAGVSAYRFTRGDTTPVVSTVTITRGDVVEAVVATGTVQAVTTVQVGSQVSGTVAWLGADFNSTVRKGQRIARLDPSLLEAQLRQSRAALQKAQADVNRTRAEQANAEQKLARAVQLSEKELLAQSELDTAILAVETAKATSESARAQLAQAEASVAQNEVNLEHASITTPIDGTVIARNVDVGQTVAASLSSPTLFEIAADLTKMQLKADIDEADIGRVQAGQAVRFTVDAYPQSTFTGTVSQVRLQPTVSQNVTTYVSVIDVANPDLRLKPGMTASIHIEIVRRNDVPRVPNTALRFKPTDELLAALGQQEQAPLGRGSHLWTYANGKLTPVAVRTGISDATLTELADTPLPPGTAVVSSMSANGAKSATTRGTTTTSPLLPTRPAGGRGGPGGPM